MGDDSPSSTSHTNNKEVTMVRSQFRLLLLTLVAVLALVGVTSARHPHLYFLHIQQHPDGWGQHDH